MKYKLPILILLVSRALFAVDGQALINLATVTAAGGFPYHITQPGSYKLSGNLSSPLNKTTIQIESNDVTLDLNGFNVKCSFNEASLFGGSCISDGRVATSGVTIRNGSITMTATAPTFNFAVVTGINLLSSKAATIENVRFDAPVIHNFSANGLDGPMYSILRFNVFADNASPNVGCPSLVEGNVNQTGGAGSSGTGCQFVNNVGLF